MYECSSPAQVCNKVLIAVIAVLPNQGGHQTFQIKFKFISRFFQGYFDVSQGFGNMNANVFLIWLKKAGWVATLILKTNS